MLQKMRHGKAMTGAVADAPQLSPARFRLGLLGRTLAVGTHLHRSLAVKALPGTGDIPKIEAKVGVETLPDV